MSNRHLLNDKDYDSYDPMQPHDVIKYCVLGPYGYGYFGADIACIYI